MGSSSEDHLFAIQQCYVTARVCFIRDLARGPQEEVLELLGICWYVLLNCGEETHLLMFVLLLQMLEMVDKRCLWR